jgi:hypothetical protein
MKRRNYYFSDIQIERLQKVADSRGISLSELIRRILDDYLDKVDRHDSK